MCGLRESHEREKGALARERRSEMDSMTKRLQDAEQHHEIKITALAHEHKSKMDGMTKRFQDAKQNHLNELDRLKYEHIKIDLSPPSGSFNRSLESRQASFYPQGFDPQAITKQYYPYKYPQIYQNQDIPPQFPRPGYQPFAHIPGQYDPHAQPISRNSSPISEQRPASSIGHGKETKDL
jgi:hypothetical protein